MGTGTKPVPHFIINSITIIWQMKKSKRHNRHNNLQDHNRVGSKANSTIVQNSIDQKALQEVPFKKEANDLIDLERKSTLENELQGYRYSQSSKFSSVSRTLILGIIGTIWTIILNSEKGSTCHPLLTLALLLSILYLVCDVRHYYKDSKNYFERQFKLSKATTNADLDEHDIQMDNLSIQSQRYVKMKYWILCISVMSFLVGMIDSFYLSDTLLDVLIEICNCLNLS